MGRGLQRDHITRFVDSVLQVILAILDWSFYDGPIITKKPRKRTTKALPIETTTTTTKTTTAEAMTTTTIT